MRPLTPYTITDPEVLIAELQTVRARGYAVDEGEHHTGVRCFAIPLKGPLHLAVSVSAPETRLSDEVATERVLPELRLLADRIQIAVDEVVAEPA